QLTRDDCSCEEEKTFFGNLISRDSVTDLELVFDAAERQEVKERREREYHHFRERTRSSADALLFAKANSPLEYPIQGVEVRPMKTILIPVGPLLSPDGSLSRAVTAKVPDLPVSKTDAQ
ncbi:hypothetical protein chiPu_0021718, partial [Chiloscyllium punctatum]|nr:hypothetical protein [Chiloscyllium punctatum]